MAKQWLGLGSAGMGAEANFSDILLDLESMEIVMEVLVRWVQSSVVVDVLVIF